MKLTQTTTGWPRTIWYSIWLVVHPVCASTDAPAALGSRGDRRVVHAIARVPGFRTVDIADERRVGVAPRSRPCAGQDRLLGLLGQLGEDPRLGQAESLGLERDGQSRRLAVERHVLVDGRGVQVRGRGEMADVFVSGARRGGAAEPLPSGECHERSAREGGQADSQARQTRRDENLP